MRYVTKLKGNKNALDLRIKVRPKPKSRAYPSEAPFYGRLLSVPTSIRLGWKGLGGSNTLAYCKKLKKKVNIVGP
jgi:hypothetical protein